MRIKDLLRYKTSNPKSPNSTTVVRTYYACNILLMLRNGPNAYNSPQALNALNAEHTRPTLVT